MKDEFLNQFKFNQKTSKIELQQIAHDTKAIKALNNSHVIDTVLEEIKTTNLTLIWSKAFYFGSLWKLVTKFVI